MSHESIMELESLDHLRLAFDEAFARPPWSREDGEPVIQIRAGGEMFAIRTGDISGLMRLETLTPLPSRIPEALGLTTRRGMLIPVFDLAALLGLAAGPNRPAWLALVSRGAAIGLAFDGFEGRATPEWIGDEPGGRRHVRQIVRTETAVCAVLDIPGLAEAIRQKAGLTEPAMETKR